MKTLPAGTPKILLVNDKAVDANVRRERRSAPVAIVVEITEAGPVEHTGHAFLTEGPVSLTYAPRAFALKTHRRKIRAAYTTLGRVAISEAFDESLSFPEAPPAPQDETKSEPPKDTTTSTPTKPEKADKKAKS